jgi:hypothetical protein
MPDEEDFDDYVCGTCAFGNPCGILLKCCVHNIMVDYESPPCEQYTEKDVDDTDR